MTEVCTMSAIATHSVGAACPGCGHTNLVHPHPYSNPALGACAICLLLAHSDADPDQGVRTSILGSTVVPDTKETR